MKKIKSKNYGVLTAGDETYVLLSPQPFLPEYWFPESMVTFYVAYIGDIPSLDSLGDMYFPYSDPHFVTVNGTFQIDWKETPLEVEIDVPDNWKEQTTHLFKPSNI